MKCCLCFFSVPSQASLSYSRASVFCHLPFPVHSEKSSLFRNTNVHKRAMETAQNTHIHGKLELILGQYVGPKQITDLKHYRNLIKYTHVQRNPKKNLTLGNINPPALLCYSQRGYFFLPASFSLSHVFPCPLQFFGEGDRAAL